jgi:hypothetical protein
LIMPDGDNMVAITQSGDATTTAQTFLFSEELPANCKIVLSANA